MKENREADEELQRFIQQVEREGIIKAPAHMKEEILKKSRTPSIQIAKESKNLSVKAELFFYGLKVTAAVAGAIFLLGTVPLTQGSWNLQVPGMNQAGSTGKYVSQKLNEKANEFSSTLNQFSERLRIGR